MVRLADGRTYEADVIGTDAASAIAVLQVKFIEPEDSIPIIIGNSSDVIVGEPILFLGYNWITRSRISYDFGVVSALRPKYPTIEESTNQYFQINVPQNYGNEGGVVVNSNGEVIAIMTDISPYSDATEIHFALPIASAIEVVDAILDEGEMHRPWFGYRLLEMTPQIERAYSILSDLNGDGLVTNADRDLFEEEWGFDLRECIFIIWVDEDSPAADAGLREGDILLKFNGVPVPTMNDLRNQIDRYRIGDRVTMEWVRREYTIWDAYLAEVTVEYSGQRDEEEEEE
jgi:S1-C subfamily serine protease